MNADVFKTILNFHLGSPTAIANAAKSFQQNDKGTVALGVAQTVDTLVNLAKKTPFGTPLTAASLLNQSNHATNDREKYGTIQDSTLYAIASDTASLLTTVKYCD